MPNYEVELTKHIKTSIACDDPKEVIESMVDLYPEHMVDYIKGPDGYEDYPERCDGCAKIILSTEIALTNDDIGDNYCAECADAIKEDSEVQP